MTGTLPTLNIIGAGAVGKSLGRAFFVAKAFDIQAIASRTQQSASDAVAFIGAGKVTLLENLPRANVTMITTSDDAIVDTAINMVANNIDVNDTTVFHTSGGQGAALLMSLGIRGAHIASVHPFKTFPEPEFAARGMSGVICGTEGDENAVNTVSKAFTLLGAKTAPIDPKSKMLYHAGAVFACNYLTVLLDARKARGLMKMDEARATVRQFQHQGKDIKNAPSDSIGQLLVTATRACEHAGMKSNLAVQAVGRIAAETLDNIDKFGTVRAFTGPIARGSVEFVERQIDAVKGWNAKAADLYLSAAEAAIFLSYRKRVASTKFLERLQKIIRAASPL